jgi:hypothetical protein
MTDGLCSRYDNITMLHGVPERVDTFVYGVIYETESVIAEYIR